MDGSSSPPTPQAPPTPYREGKPLAEIIPPDRRRAKAAALIGASMVSGVVLWVLGGWAIDALRATTPEPVIVQTPGYVGGIVPRSVLSGPGGTFAMPPPTRSVVNVWLQGCGDCMPAFNAMAQLQSEGGLHVDAPIINVAYGEADETWARRYGVANNLVFDGGGRSLVRPLGIGTFTTLVVEPSGAIIHRDRPDRPGFARRVRAAVRYGDPSFVEPPPLGDPLANPDLPVQAPHVLDGETVQGVVAIHRAAMKRACWDGREHGTAPVTVRATLSVTIGTDGRVTQTSAEGDDPALSRCLEAQTRMWVFPGVPSPTTVSIPFNFVQQ